MDQSDSCCKVMAELVANILNLSATVSPFREVPPLSPVKQWKETEALEIDKNGHREQYRKP
ncbi:hypothetical protein Syn6312_0900 [Synechococcus sp. PCC 6312]|nr:hypothetical protein Syn6312_0900 [Synechococcus sp. PCC 6312]